MSNLYADIDERPDRDTDAHRRTLYAKDHPDERTIRIMSAGDGEWIESTTYRANYR